jgi:hypothetical protein
MATSDVINFQTDMTKSLPSGGTVSSPTSFLVDLKTGQHVTLQDSPTATGNIVSQIVRGTALIVGRSYQFSQVFLAGQVNAVNIEVTVTTEIDCVLQP